MRAVSMAVSLVLKDQKVRWKQTMAVRISVDNHRREEKDT